MLAHRLLQRFMSGFVVLSLAGVLAGDAHAQRGAPGAVGDAAIFLGPANANQAPYGVAPFFQVAPGLNIQQAAFNVGLMGRAYQNFPPYAMGFAPPYALGYGRTNPGVLYPGTSQAIANSGFRGFPPPFYNPFFNPYFNSWAYPYQPFPRQVYAIPPVYDPYLFSFGPAYSSIPFLASSGPSPYMQTASGPGYGTNQLATQPGGGQGNYSQQRPAAQQPLSNPVQGLNLLLADVHKIQANTARGGQSELDPKVLSKLRFAPDLHVKHSELLQKLSNWPTGLSGRDFQSGAQELMTLTPQVLNQAMLGKVEPAMVKRINTAIDDLNRQLALNITNISTSQYTEAKRFLTNLEELVQLLKNPVKTPKGRTVGELLRSMKENGVQFAAAAEGDEDAYKELQDLFGQYRDANRPKDREK